MDEIFSNKLRELVETTTAVVEHKVAPDAERVDREAAWPEPAMLGFAAAGLMGLHVPARLGGHEQGLLALAALTEVIARECPSAALCYGMHCVATAVIAAKATPYHENRYLRPIAEGRHISTLSLSESGTGVHFYLSQTELVREEGGFVVNGTKQFVTNGGRADSYVVSTRASVLANAGEFSCLMVDRETPGIAWQEPWNGFGMRGNSSRGLKLEKARVPFENLLGEEGCPAWYAVEIVAPYFLMAMAGTCLGIAQAALDATILHLQARQYTHSGEVWGGMPVLQHRLAEIWTAVEKTRGLIQRAAHLGDLGDPRALV